METDNWIVTSKKGRKNVSSNVHLNEKQQLRWNLGLISFQVNYLDDKTDVTSVKKRSSSKQNVSHADAPPSTTCFQFVCRPENEREKAEKRWMTSAQHILNRLIGIHFLRRGWFFQSRNLMLNMSQYHFHFQSSFVSSFWSFDRESLLTFNFIWVLIRNDNVCV